MTFLEKIEMLMAYKGINKRQLSISSGIPYSTIDNLWKKGYENIKLSTLRKISSYFGVSLDFLVRDDVNENFNLKEIVAEQTEENLLHNCNALKSTSQKQLTTDDMSFSTAEINHIQKYRVLDKRGKKVVDLVLNTEHEASIKETERKSRDYTFPRFHNNRASAGYGYDLSNPDDWSEILVVDTPEAHRADFAVQIEGDSMEPSYHDGDIVYIKMASEIPIGQVGLFRQNDMGFVKEVGKNRLISRNPDYPDIYPEDGEIMCVGRVIGVAQLAEE